MAEDEVVGCANPRRAEIQVPVHHVAEANVSGGLQGRGGSGHEPGGTLSSVVVEALASLCGSGCEVWKNSTATFWFWRIRPRSRKGEGHMVSRGAQEGDPDSVDRVPAGLLDLLVPFPVTLIQAMNIPRSSLVGVRHLHS